jgi:hypothetical protein
MAEQLSIYNGVVKRLEFLKYNVSENEKSIIEYMILKTVSSVNNLTNQCYTSENIPYGLYSIVVDKVCGEFLMFKKNMGGIPELDLSPIEKQIQEGDTSVTYAVDGVTSPEKRFDNLINFLMTGRDDELVKYRRLAW